MQTVAQVSFDDLPVDEAVREAALAHVADLERYSRRITGCHVVVAQPHRHHRAGRLYSVRIDLVVPGGEIVVNRAHHLDHAHEDPLVTLRDTFAAARRRLEDCLRRRRGAVKAHQCHDEGRILRVLPAEEHGFITAADGREIYFHAHALCGDSLDGLVAGTPVRFTVEEGDDGPQATWVHVTGPAPVREGATGGEETR